MGSNGRNGGGEGDRLRMNGDEYEKLCEIHKEQYLLSKGVHYPMRGKEKVEEKKMLLVC